MNRKKALNNVGGEIAFSRLGDATWLAPRLVLLTLGAVLLSLLCERIGAPGTLLLALNVLSYAAGGYYGARQALTSLRQGQIDVDLLMILAALGAALIGEWHEGAILLFLFSLSNVLQDYAIGRSRSAIRSLFTLYPEVAKVKRGSEVRQLRIDEIRVGDTVLIEPGERIPIDGKVIGGGSAVDESPITGESIPVDKVPGASVFAGTLNTLGSLDVRAQRKAAESTLSRIINLVEEAQESKAPTERYLERFEQRYAKLIIFCIALIIILPPALGLVDFDSNFYRAMVLMTVASPCALVISVPSAFISAIASAARGGVLIKGGTSLEELNEIKVVALDKTGTLTVGKPVLTDLVAAEGIDKDDLLRCAASVEARSEHPLAKAIVDFAENAGMSLQQTESFAAVPGKFVRAQLHGQEVRVGRIALFSQEVSLPADLRNAQIALEAAGKTVVGALRNEQWMGLIALADACRAEAPELLRKLRARGIAAVMLTGDNHRVADTIAAQVGIERVYAGLLPEDKSDIVTQLREEYGAVAMIGDGINDAPALARANVGIAMGGAGADVALETADVVLMGDKLARLDDALRLAARAKRVVWQNIGFSLAVIALLILGVFAVQLPLPVGVLGHEGSTVIVVLNGLISLLILPEIRRRRASEVSAETAVVPTPQKALAASGADIFPLK
ncbi:MAG: heavy metal translocating P-type ATPase [Chloroflexi bacterium]|nr:heavy metal translocating P-type ATPase [Chloroflexota bacterium]